MRTTLRTTPRAVLATGAALAAGIAGLAVPGAVSPASAAVPACTTGHLSARVVGVQGAAGTEYITIRLTNTGRASCTMRGYPGVSMVYGSHGTQAGAPADWARMVTPRSVTATPRHSTSFVVAIVQGPVTGDTTPSGCGRIVAARGFRVYPPGSRTALFAPFSGLRGCTHSGLHLMRVSAVGSSIV